MTELKTIRTIPHEPLELMGYSRVIYDCDIISRTQVKLELIKHIKQLDTQIQSTFQYPEKHSDNSITISFANRLLWRGAKECLIQFGEITEEDLK